MIFKTITKRPPVNENSPFEQRLCGKSPISSVDYVLTAKLPLYLCHCLSWDGISFFPIYRYISLSFSVFVGGFVRWLPVFIFSLFLTLCFFVLICHFLSICFSTPSTLRHKFSTVQAAPTLHTYFSDGVIDWFCLAHGGSSSESAMCQL